MTLELEDGRTAFYQWDTGQRLVVTGGCGQIHFCHSGDKTALVCPIREEAGKLVADVPNILLQKAETIYAYAYGEGEDGSKTLWARSFAVKPRPKPEDYVYTQTEVLSYETLADRVAKLEGEGLSQAVADYLKDNPVQAGATAEEAAQIWQNKTDIAGKLDASALPAAVENALSQAKASGDFKGEPGSDYVLTDTDKQEIAELTAPLVDVPEGGSNQPLTFTGAVNATYDGSEAVSVEIPTGGGGSGGAEWRQIAKVTLSEDARSIEITKDGNGNPFELSEFAYIIVGKSLGTSGNIGVKINGALTYYRTNLSNTNTTAELKSGGYGAFASGWVITFKERFDAASEGTGYTSVTNISMEKMKSFWYGCTSGAPGVGFQAGTILELWGR